MEQISITLDMALDMLPVIGEIYDKLNVKEYSKSIAGKKIEPEKMGMDFVFKHIFKKAKDIKPELLELAAIAYEMDVEDAKRLKWTKVIAVVMSIKDDEELNSFSKMLCTRGI